MNPRLPVWLQMLVLIASWIIYMECLIWITEVEGQSSPVKGPGVILLKWGLPVLMLYLAARACWTNNKLQQEIIIAVVFLGVCLSVAMYPAVQKSRGGLASMAYCHDCNLTPDAPHFCHSHFSEIV